MGWTVKRVVSLDAAASAGTYAQPITIRSYDGRPRIRSVTVLNQSPNVNVGICIQQAKPQPDYIGLAQYLTVQPIEDTDQIVLLFSVPSGAQQSGNITVTVSEEQLAAASALVPAANSGGSFILDVSQLDNGKLG